MEGVLWVEERTKRIGLKTCFRIVEAWGLPEDEGVRLLGCDHMPALSEVTFDQLERISHILGIYKSLHTLFPSKANADAWIKKPNSASLFAGRTALDVLRDGITGLRAVRSYLEAEVLGIHPPQSR